MKQKILLLTFVFIYSILSGQNLRINDLEYFEMQGLNVMVFDDFYPEGHQSGVTIIQHGIRVAANGDVRLEISPGQWSSVPRGGKRVVDKEEQSITKQLWYPDSSRNQRSFNPIPYPDLTFSYKVKVKALKGSSFLISVNLDKSLPAEWIGKVGFNLELFPGDLFGKAYIMDDRQGIFPLQPGGPMHNYHGKYLTDPLATGKKLIISPEQREHHIEIVSKTEALELWDGRSNHNNGWYIVRSIIPAHAKEAAVEWVVTPDVVKNWIYVPKVFVSQIGYHPAQVKKAIIECDKTDNKQDNIIIYRLTDGGNEIVISGKPEKWGKFLRYHYMIYDFSDVKDPGMYIISYGSTTTSPFKISNDVYGRHTWQPTLEYFLPVQMCHMRVNENYRVWHDACHLDDALMAPVNIKHFDGYSQDSTTFTKYQPFQAVPGLNAGGWHDAGDYDLRIESQILTIWMLCLMIEEFGLDYDATTIDQDKRIVEIHKPDGVSDALQQIEHGLLSVLGGYRSLGRPYRGIICSDLRQYVMLGDASAMTDNLVYDSTLSAFEVQDKRSGKMDDRWIFTEENPDREMYVIAGLSAASRVLRFSNPDLSNKCLQTALELWKRANKTVKWDFLRILALSELILTTDDREFKKILVNLKDNIIKNINHCGWAVAHVIDKLENSDFKNIIAEAVYENQLKLRLEAADSPFGIPYKPRIWGAGWTLQQFGVQQYFIYKAWPEYHSDDFFLNVLNFVLGVHPGENNSSFVSGIGSKSVKIAYGVNRADWSYIPGGVVSGTALIRPDLPELKIWPFLWQQTEYVVGGGATCYMFLVMAADDFFNK